MGEILNFLRIIRPFLIITICCIVGVLVFYRLAEHYWLRPLVITAGMGSSKGLTAEKQVMGKNSDYQIILKRNLFGTGPAGSEVEDSQNDLLAGLQDAVPDMLLLGTVTGDEKEERAIILDTVRKKQHLVHVGDVLNGAVVKEIQREKVTLHLRERDEILDMTETRRYFSNKKATNTLGSRQEKSHAIMERTERQFGTVPTVQNLQPVRKFFRKVEGEGPN